jgi:acyl dehydratase
VRGRLISVQPTSVGVCSVVRLDLLDATDGAAVATQYTTTLYRGVACSDQGRALENVPNGPISESWNDPLSEVSIPIDRALPYLYDGCTGVTFPIHISQGFATERAGLPDIVLQGTCSLSLVAREIVNREASGEPERLSELACRFSRIVIPGTTVRLQLMLHAECRGSRQFTFRLLNADGEEALSRGWARITR